MLEEHSAITQVSSLSKVSSAPSAPSDYDTICAALMQTERGRWFLHEYARRNRGADTELLLAAIQRIEAVVCTERDKQAQHEFRSDLLEMANAITRTRAEVAEIKSATPPAPAARSPLPQPRDIFAAAERIRDVTWAMRGHGFDPSTCDQLEALAASILSASALRDPTDHRVSKLSEVLQYLEQRIGTLLQDGGAPPASPDIEPPPEPDITAPSSVEVAVPVSGSASTLVEHAEKAGSGEEPASTIELQEEAADPPLALPEAEPPPASHADTPIAAEDTAAATASTSLEDNTEAGLAAVPVASETLVEFEIEGKAAAEVSAEVELLCDAELEAAHAPEIEEPAPLSPGHTSEDSCALSDTTGAEKLGQDGAQDEAGPSIASLDGPPGIEIMEVAQGEAADLIGTVPIAVHATPLPELGQASATQIEEHPVAAVAHAPQQTAQTLLPAIEMDFAAVAPRERASAAAPRPVFQTVLARPSADAFYPKQAPETRMAAVSTSASAPSPPANTPSEDPLAALKAMSEDELIALFS
jgi:hypothetical protein